MKLRLAEYKNGKFERFLELVEEPFYEGFLLGKDFIMVMDEEAESRWERINNIYYEDKKDPLNRFDGLFDGRTYGEGRFVLILNIGEVFQDDVLESRWLGGDLEVASNQPDEDKYYFLPNEVIGNLHENPELFLKIHGSQN